MYLVQCFCLKKNERSGFLNSGLGFIIIAGTEVAEVHFQLKARNKEINYLLMQPPIVIRSKMRQNATFSTSPSAVRCHVYPDVF